MYVFVNSSLIGGGICVLIIFLRKLKNSISLFSFVYSPNSSSSFPLFPCFEALSQDGIGPGRYIRIFVTISLYDISFIFKDGSNKDSDDNSTKVSNTLYMSGSRFCNFEKMIFPNVEKNCFLVLFRLYQLPLKVRGLLHMQRCHHHRHLHRCVLS